MSGQKLEAVEGEIAHVTEALNETLRNYPNMSFNDVKDLERTKLKELRALQIRRNRILAAQKRAEERKAAKK